MNNRVYFAIMLMFLCVIVGVPTYWFGLRPAEIRKQCLALSLETAYEAYQSRDEAMESVRKYFESRTTWLSNQDPRGQKLKKEILFLMMKQKQGYQICLKLNGLDK